MKKAHNQKITLFVLGYQKSFRNGIPELSFSYPLKYCRVGLWSPYKLHTSKTKSHRVFLAGKNKKSSITFHNQAF